MTPALRLLGDVSWRGAPLAGERLGALLAALTLNRSGVSDAGLIDVVWDDDLPANPHKALQVLVSRVRAQCGPTVVTRQGSGYRLGLGTDEVDALLLGSLVEQASERLGAGDPEKAAELAGQALGLATSAETRGDGPLAQVRAAAGIATREAQRLRGLALTRSGREREALDLLEAVNRQGNDSPELLAALLRAEAAVRGVPAALDRFESYRCDLRDRLGVDPDPSLQRVHRELLAADDPVRTGVRFDAEELLGRGADLARLRAAVRSGRLTSIIGPGGIGKTRIAHVLAREATQSRVHFVELVGITSSEDVVAEVGAALGVRGSVTGRSTHTPAQRSDIRGRIAQELDSAPTMLVLDNCEHVIEAVASLVAFLLVTARDLRVVTTSRAPLNIAAEQVVLLDQLEPGDGAALFVRRARAARPTADLDADLVTEVVSRLDGLPLAIELAAARIRAMSLEELRQRLDDRFALLRGRDRSAPARHQTLTAVIAWSWDLLGPDEQRALAWLSVFHDGFGAAPAEALLGPDAMDLVEALVDQSLLSVMESDGVARFRMLETVREFATLRLAESGDTAAALSAQTAWAVAVSGRLGLQLFSPNQIAAVDELSIEENNLADVLRRALADDEPASAVRLLAALGILWAITGNHPRVFALADAAERMIERWVPPPELVYPTQEALSILLSHLGILQNRPVDSLVTAMARLGVPEEPWARAAYAMFVESDNEEERLARVLAMAESSDNATAVMALQWAAVLSENEGDIAGAAEYAGRAMALVDERTTAWQLASLHTHLALLAMHAGDHRSARENAELGWPLLLRLHAYDDAAQVRAGMAMAALMAGDVVECEQILTEIADQSSGQSFGGHMIESSARAELALARGELREGLRLYLASVEEMRGLKFAGMEPSGIEPWTLTSEAAALMAHVRHASTGEDALVRDELARVALDKTRELMVEQPSHMDYPVSGMSFAALAAWLFASDDPARQRAGVDLLALADRFSYNRTFPVMAWVPLADAAESADPGRLGVLLEEYAGRPGRELLGEGIAVLDRVEVLLAEA